MTWDGTAISVDLPRAYRSWSPFTIDLTPETFGVTLAGIVVGRAQGLFPDRHRPSLTR